MNLNQIVNMVVRMVMRRLVSRGVNAGIDRAVKGRSPGGAGAAGPDQSAAGKQTAQRARKGLRIMRRIGRM